MPEITEQSVSSAWLQAVRLADTSPRNEISNLILNVIGLQSESVVEDPLTRSALDEALDANGLSSVATVANTIFPASLWKRDCPRSVLYSRYIRLWPRIQRVRKNRRGTYFQRLIAYPTPSADSLNQLEFVIDAFRNRIRRRSALQCGILAPKLDLNATPYQGFPCMQQVAFVPEANDGLRITALYPMQYLWERAYGNYLGLIALGRFMAAAMDLELRAMTCIALVAKLEKPGLAQPFLESGSEI